MYRFLKRLVIAGLLALAVILAAPLFMRAYVGPYTYVSVQDVPPSDVAIVLGASVEDGKPSPILADRANAAVELFDAGKVQKILVTGDNGALNHDEVTPVRQYLLAAGIPAQDIFLDHAGFDTYSSMYRAKAVFDASSVVITTQNFHLPRSLFIARMLGLRASGFVADGTATPFEYAREIPASWKALIDLVLHRVPKYLGPQIPLSGDGRTTWY